MPCRCEEPWESHARLSGIADRLTQDLCFLCGQLTHAGELKRYASPRILDWWEKHCQADHIRVVGQFCDEFRSMQVLGPDEARAAARRAISRAEAVHPMSEYHKRWFERVATEAYFFVQRQRNRESENLRAARAALDKLTPKEREALGE